MSHESPDQKEVLIQTLVPSNFSYMRCLRRITCELRTLFYMILTFIFGKVVYFFLILVLNILPIKKKLLVVIFYIYILSYFWFILSADRTHSELLCCSLSCKHWNANSRPFPLESCWYFTCCCYFSDHCKDHSGNHCCQGIWLLKQDVTSCNFSLFTSSLVYFVKY